MAQARPVTKLQLHISLNNIPRLDLTSASDPMVVVYLTDPLNGRESEVGRTEVITNAKDCNFATAILLDYFFEEVQAIRFAAYDIDSARATLDDHDFIGSAQVHLGAILGQHRGVFTSPLTNGKGTRGSITVTAEEVSEGARGFLNLQCRGAGLDKKDLFGKSDPYLTFLRESEHGKYVTVFKTQVIMKTLDPTWPPFQIPLRDMCNGKWEQRVKIECYDWDRDGSHDFIGECFTTTRALVDAKSSNFDLINPKKQSKKGYKNSGTLSIACSFQEEHSFADYVRGGFSLNVTFGIDFTGSNGDPRLPSSLHYMDPRAPNQYAQAISAVGAVIQDYDSDNLFPALGFGAKFPDGAISHNFSLTGDYRNPYCQGIAGVLAAYQRTLSQVTLWGPTNFAPIINHVADIAAGQARDANSYMVLLMITDGAITDMADTEEAIVRAASLPMSIIIIGVGPADFSLMERLDGDGEKLSSKGRQVSRDIVQFVPFRNFSGPHAAHLLAKEVLAELPSQFMAYMQMMKIQPPVRADAPPPAYAAPPY